MDRNSTQGYGMKSDEKPIFCQIHMIFVKEKMIHVVIDRYFSLLLKGFEGFS